MIHLVGPVVLAAALAGTGVYGLLARRNAVLVLIGAELVLNAANVLLVTANTLPPTGLAGLRPGTGAAGAASAGAADPLLPGQVMAVFVVTIAAAEIGLALAVVLLVYRRRATSDLGSMRELGEASATYTELDGAGEWTAAPPPDVAVPAPGASRSVAPPEQAGDRVGERAGGHVREQEVRP